MIRLFIPLLLILHTFLQVAAQPQRADSMLAVSLKTGDSYPDSALALANQAELIYLKSDPGNRLPDLYRIKGSIYQLKGSYQQSLLYYRKAYEEFIKMEDLKGIAGCALQLGNIFFELANFSEAYFYYLQSLNAYERDENREGVAQMENRLGAVSHRMGNLEEAEKHYMNSLRIFRQLNLATEKATAMNRIGLILHDKRQYDSALVYFHEALQILEIDSSGSEVASAVLSGVYSNTARVHSEKGDYQQALGYLLRGLDLSRDLQNLFQTGRVYMHLGSLYGRMERQDSALFYLHRALQISRQRGFRQLMLETYDELAQLHAFASNYASAYNWQLRYDTLYKELFNEIQSEQIAQLRARYEQEIKDREIEQLQSETQIQKTLNLVFIIFIALTVILLIIIAVNLRNKKRTNLMLENNNRQISSTLQRLSESEKELQRLNRSKDRIFSVVAHDLRNPVSAVAGFSELLYDNFDQFSPETQKEYLLQILQGTRRIQDLLENLLVWSRSQMHSVNFQPEKLKMRELVDECLKELKPNIAHKRIDFSVKLDRRCVVTADRAMIHMVLRNLIMNAVKFSFPGGKVYIASEQRPGECVVLVSDEGIGIHQDIQGKLFDSSEMVTTPGTTGEAGSGLGLVICKEFVEKNRGKIEVESEPGKGAAFRLILPE